MEMTFNLGDVVGLKSGGPDMTVTAICCECEEVVCTWFADKKLEKTLLCPEALVKYED